MPEDKMSLDDFCGEVVPADLSLSQFEDLSSELVHTEEGMAKAKKLAGILHRKSIADILYFYDSQKLSLIQLFAINSFLDKIKASNQDKFSGLKDKILAVMQIIMDRPRKKK
jgi:hypothetical protein